MCARSDETMCRLCDMPIWLCVHRGLTPLPVIDSLPLLPVSHPAQWVIRFGGSGYDRPWESLDHAREVEVISCVGDGHERGEMFLCPACTEAFERLLGDVPALVHDLDLAITRQTAFVEHGTAEDVRDESPLPFDQSASRALLQLAWALDASSASLGAVAVRSRLILRDFHAVLLDANVGRRAHRLSLAVLHAHQTIDRPPDAWYYGPCPKCERDIYDERGVEHVTCSRCDYSASMHDHQLACLNAGDERMLTIAELVGAITRAGETVTRDQINGWIRRDGLMRELDERVLWRDGKLVRESVRVYRLGDVRRLALEAEQRKANA